MQIKDIAKAVGMTSVDVAKDLKGSIKGVGPEGELPSQGVAMCVVENDDIAKAYIEEKGRQIEDDLEQQARFWTRSNNLVIAKRGDAIRFVNHVYVCDLSTRKGREDAALLEKPQNKHGMWIYRVVREPHKSDELRMEFRRFCRALIYTGYSQQEGPAISGLDAVRAMLPEDVVNKNRDGDLINPATLLNVVTQSISLDVEQYRIERDV